MPDLIEPRWVDNVSELKAEPPAQVHRPTAVAQVAELIGARKPSDPALRSISSGRNWGLGSATSDAQNAAVFDLSGLDSIRELNAEGGYAVIEPGVTQADLSEALIGTGRYLNCTASSARTSVLGNMMDRGVGIRHQRTRDLLGLEVVTGEGLVGTIGWWPDTRGLAPNPFGLGPSLLHAFTQSNLAVATAGVVRLLPVPEATTTLTVSIAESEFAELVEVLRSTMRDDLSSGVIKIYDPTSADMYGGSKVVTAHICVDGARSVVDAKVAEITRRLDSIGAHVLPAAEVRGDPLAHAVSNLYHGDVSNSEDIVRSALGTTTEDADRSGGGWIFVLPFVPFNAEHLTRARGIVQSVSAEHHVPIGTTVNGLDHDVVDLVIAIKFDRQLQVQEAHRGLDDLVKRLTGAGYHPYRLDTSHSRSDVHPAQDLETRLIDSLRQAIDPLGAFAPNRYLR